MKFLIYLKWFTCSPDRTGILETFEIDFLFVFSLIGNIIYDAFLILDLTLMLAGFDGRACLCLNKRPSNRLHICGVTKLRFKIRPDLLVS